MVPHSSPTKHSSWLMAIPYHIFIINVRFHRSGMKTERVISVDFALCFGQLLYWWMHPNFRNSGFFCVWNRGILSFWFFKNQRGCKPLPSNSDFVSDHFDLIVSWWDFTTCMYTWVKVISDQTDWNQTAILHIIMQITSLHSNSSSVPPPFWLFLSCIQSWPFKFKSC